MSSANQGEQGIPKEEEDILSYFLELRNYLSRLKQNRNQFLTSKDVVMTYQEVLTKVRELDKIRKTTHESSPNLGPETTLIHSVDLHNRVDSVIDDVFQLLSLCFLTVGLKNSAPATYASLSTVQSLLDHLNESNVYTHNDLKPIKERLDEISEIVEKNSYWNIPTDGGDGNAFADDLEDKRKENNIEENLLLRAKLEYCLKGYNQIEAKLEAIPEDLQPFMERLFQIRRGLLSLAASAKSRVEQEEQDENDDELCILSHEKINERLKALETELADVRSHRNESGKFVSVNDPNDVPEKGQFVLNGLLDDCHDLIRDLSHQTSAGLDLDPHIQPIYDDLVSIKTILENLLVTRRWTLRETDLFTYQKKLAELDSLRVNGKFPSESSDSKGQAILLYLLRRCYAIIYKLLESSEPVSESLERIHNQLSTVRHCLLELKRMGGVDNERELYPYQMKLASLDNMRVDGKFYDPDGNIPEGQGTLNALLAECFDILHEMKIEAEVREEAAQSNEAGEKPPNNINNQTIQMTKDGTNRDVAEVRPNIRYLDVYNPNREDDGIYDDVYTHYSDHSYEEDETTNLDD
ncbi:Cub1p Ecym_8352 [Eremothecium cymbalariae DBVPG|uniref:Uncharacterized protein n=1 Tax=Eremothecium cymbalariae (strain CBS 270.75 / DBVPG 7215 / KCTC 17166 / NRRL Y-17582) TaxID=931890 RepID=G8JXQ1_ERECY|nr:Hypothetical protein Ecym_8352 [Eremothecium cymbalariae DBVPG\